MLSQIRQISDGNYNTVFVKNKEQKVNLDKEIHDLECWKQSRNHVYRKEEKELLAHLDKLKEQQEYLHHLDKERDAHSTESPNSTQKRHSVTGSTSLAHNGSGFSPPARDGSQEFDSPTTPAVPLQRSRLSIHNPHAILPPVQSFSDKRALHRVEGHTNICLVCQLPRMTYGNQPPGEAVCCCDDQEGRKFSSRRSTATGHEDHSASKQITNSPVQVGQRRHSLMMARLNESHHHVPHPPERGHTGKSHHHQDDHVSNPQDHTHVHPHVHNHVHMHDDHGYHHQHHAHLHHVDHVHNHVHNHARNTHGLHDSHVIDHHSHHGSAHQGNAHPSGISHHGDAHGLHDSHVIDHHGHNGSAHHGNAHHSGIYHHGDTHGLHDSHVIDHHGHNGSAHHGNAHQSGIAHHGGHGSSHVNDHHHSNRRYHHSNHDANHTPSNSSRRYPRQSITHFDPHISNNDPSNPIQHPTGYQWIAKRRISTGGSLGYIAEDPSGDTRQRDHELHWDRHQVCKLKGMITDPHYKEQLKVENGRTYPWSGQYPVNKSSAEDIEALKNCRYLRFSKLNLMNMKENPEKEVEVFEKEPSTFE